MNLHVSGIYQIRNIHTGRVYIGRSVDIHRRWLKHRRMLIRGIHVNVELQQDWNKYGEQAFTCNVLEYVSGHEALGNAEMRYWNATCNPYNDSIPDRSTIRPDPARIAELWERWGIADKMRRAEQAERDRYLAIWKPGETPSRNTHQT